MLILSRHVGEEVILRCGSEKVVIRVLRYDTENGVRVGIDAPPIVQINRAELDARKQAEKEGNRG